MAKSTGGLWPGAPVGLLAPKRPYPGQARPRLTAYGRYVELKLPANCGRLHILVSSHLSGRLALKTAQNPKLPIQHLPTFDYLSI